MTTLLFYEDPTLLEFDATVVDATAAAGSNGVAELVLDRTAFYPEGGGQPADWGRLAGMPVVEVRKNRDAVVHIVKGAGDGADAALPAAGEVVHGIVDGAHRRDFMQQHTGQHLLSAALVHVGGYNTVSVHQGDEYTTIEIDAESIPDAKIREAEVLANSIIEANLPVTDFWTTDTEIKGYELRREPKVSGDVRIVNVGDFDAVACGGVHVQNTGAIRLVHATGVETVRGHARIYWMIGDRALADYLAKDRIVSSLTATLSARPEQIPGRVEDLAARVRSLESDARKTRARLHEIIAGGLVAGTNPKAGRRIVTADFVDEERDFLRGVAENLVTHEGVAAAITNTSGGRLQWVVAIAPGAGVAFEPIRGELLASIDGKGGGKPPIWQGAGGEDATAAAFLSSFAELVGRQDGA